MSNFSIEYLTSSDCGKSMTSPFSVVTCPPVLLTPPESETGSPPDVRNLRDVGNFCDVRDLCDVAPEVENNQTLSPPEPEVISLNGSIHALQIQANKLRINRKTKAKHSYIALISEAILNHTSRRLLLSEIYQYISDKYPQFDGQDKGWKNNIRHNLSLNQCFVKVGRCERGHYWSIHPAVIEEFSRGDFTRRLARRRVRRHLAEEQELERLSSSYYSPLNYGGSPYGVNYERITTPPSSGLRPSLSTLNSNSVVENTPPSGLRPNLLSTEQQIQQNLEIYKSSLPNLPTYSTPVLGMYTPPALHSTSTPTSQGAPIALSPDASPLCTVTDHVTSAMYMQHYHQMVNMTHGLPWYNNYLPH